MRFLHHVVAAFAAVAFAQSAVAGGPDTDRASRGHLAAKPHANWSGFYAGITGGYGEADWSGVNESSDPIIGQTSVKDLDLSGGVFAIHAGYNAQHGMWVYGLEADWSTMDWSDLATDPNGGDFVTGKVDSMVTLRGRLGPVIDRTFIYATAGVVWVDATYTARDNGTGVVGKVDFDEVGFVGGGGVDHKITDRFSIRGEALWLSVDDRINTSGLHPDSDPGDFVEFDDAWIVRGGLSYHF